MGQVTGFLNENIDALHGAGKDVQEIFLPPFMFAHLLQEATDEDNRSIKMVDDHIDFYGIAIFEQDVPGPRYVIQNLE